MCRSSDGRLSIGASAVRSFLSFLSDLAMEQRRSMADSYQGMALPNDHFRNLRPSHVYCEAATLRFHRQAPDYRPALLNMLSPFAMYAALLRLDY